MNLFHGALDALPVALFAFVAARSCQTALADRNMHCYCPDYYNWDMDRESLSVEPNDEGVFAEVEEEWHGSGMGGPVLDADTQLVDCWHFPGDESLPVTIDVLERVR